MSGNNGASQSYNFVAVILPNLELVLAGTVNSGSGPVTTMAVTDPLTDTMIYGANPTFTVTQGADTNGMVTRAMADYFAGLNFGLVASPEVVTGTVPLGALPTWNWYGNNPNGQDQPPLSITNAFLAAQLNQPYWFNSYASFLSTMSDAYGFAYNDRLQSPLLALAGGAAVTVTVLSDS